MGETVGMIELVRRYHVAQDRIAVLEAVLRECYDRLQGARYLHEHDLRKASTLATKITTTLADVPTGETK